MQVLKFYKKYLRMKFSNLSVEASISEIIELSTKDSSSMKVDLSLAATSMRWADNDNYVVSLGNNNRYEVNDWTLGN